MTFTIKSLFNNVKKVDSGSLVHVVVSANVP